MDRKIDKERKIEGRRRERKYRVFIKYCGFFSKILKYSGLWPFSVIRFGVRVCTHTRQVENPRCSRPGAVQKITKFQGKNTIFHEHPVLK